MRFVSRGESADPLVCLPHVVQHHWGGDGQDGQAQKWKIPMWRYPAQQELHDENLVPFLKIMLFMVFVKIMMMVFNTKYQIVTMNREWVVTAARCVCDERFFFSFTSF